MSENSEVETSWASLRLEPGFQQMINAVASTIRVAYYHGDPAATLDTSENIGAWQRMAEAAVKEIWFA